MIVPDFNRTTKHSDNLAVDRRSYAAPALREFGQVGALTQGGTGTVSEFDPESDMCLMVPSLALC